VSKGSLQPLLMLVFVLLLLWDAMRTEIESRVLCVAAVGVMKGV
jgi:hypothetical protein